MLYKLCTVLIVYFYFTNGSEYPNPRNLYLDNKLERDFYFYRNLRNHNIQYQESRFLCLVLGICAASQINAQRPELRELHKWIQLEFDYESDQARQRDIDSGAFIPGSPTPIDVDVYYSSDPTKSKTFVTIPRFQPGVPVTLGTISSKVSNGSPKIAPYPSWDWARNPEQCKPNRIVSVFRTQIDECGRLWVLDNGKLLENQTCSAQILAFDLKTDKLIHKFEIPSSLMEDRTLLITPAVDVRGSQCEDTFLYLADVQGYSMIVYDVQNKKAWKIVDKTLYPNPDFGTYTVDGASFELMDGLLALALTPYNQQEDRKLFFHAMSSGTENWVYTSHIRNQSRFEHNSQSSPEIFHTLRGRRTTQSAAEAIDSAGIMYFGLLKDVKIQCWNTKLDDYSLHAQDTVGNDRNKLQFPSGVKVIKTIKGKEELWVLTSAFQRVMTETLKKNEPNFRILAAKTDDLLVGTKCRKHFGGGGYGYHKPPQFG